MPSMMAKKERDILYALMVNKRDNYRDTISVFEGVRLEGRKEGNEEGRVEGEKRKAIAIARNLKSMGMSISDISKATGLSEEEIDSI